MLKSLMYRIKGFTKIDEFDDKFIFECIKCHNKLDVHKHYGKLHVVCKCGQSCNIYTGVNTRSAAKRNADIPTAAKRNADIPKELKVFDFKFSEYQGRPTIKGKYINRSIYFLKDAFGSLSVVKTDKEILIFPFLNIEKSENSAECSNVIEPFEEGEFCHFLSEDETASTAPFKESGSIPLKINFIDFDKS